MATLLNLGRNCSSISEFLGNSFNIFAYFPNNAETYQNITERFGFKAERHKDY